MKVLLITDGMDIGGAETHVATLARGLQREGMETAVLSSGGRTADALRAEGIPQFEYPFFHRSLPSALGARRFLKQIATEGGFDILHAHARYPASLLRGCGKWKNRPKCVVTAHAAFSASPLLRAVSYWGERTVAVSEDLRAHLSDCFGVPAEVITVIPNGIDLDRFYPPERAATPPARCVLFASRLDADCSLGASLLCDLAPSLSEKYPDLQITLAGGGEMLPHFFGRAEAINRGRAFPLVRTVGSVSDMPALLRQNRIFVGVSRAAMEAAACGCAVLLVGNEGADGLLTPENPAPALSNFCGRGAPLPSAEWLYGELDALLGNDAHLRTSALAARTWIAQEFDSTHTLRQMLALYRRIVPQQSCNPPRQTGEFCHDEP